MFAEFPLISPSTKELTSVSGASQNLTETDLINNNLLFLLRHAVSPDQRIIESGSQQENAKLLILS